MTLGRTLRSFTLLLALLAGFATTASAQAPISLSEFREVLLTYDAALNGCGQLEAQESALQTQINALTDEQLQALYDAIPDWDSFLLGATSVIQLCSDAQAQPTVASGAFQPEAISGTSYSPDYPSGGNYDTFIATLPGLGLLDNGKTNRTDANGVAGAWIAIETLRVAAIVAQGVCDAAPSGDIVFTNTVLCPPSAVAWAAVQATQIVLDQTGFQDGLIDSAEIEAAYENTKTLLGNSVDVYNELQQHDTDISNQLNQHDTDISNQLTQHDTDISNQLSQHDADIKAKLDLLNGKIDVLLERQLEIVRLLATPQGRRATDIPACDGAPCDFPDK